MSHPDSDVPGAWRTLPILILLYALSLMDRQVLSLMVEPIKESLKLSDFQIGLLQGLVFSVFYSVAAIPIGWMADRFPRRPIIWIGVTIWSIAAASCGLAQNFWHLLFARLGVGAGEAALTPTAYSMLADLFRPARLTLAMSVLLVGSSIGNGVAIGVGGLLVDFAESGGRWALPLLGEVESWQFVFIVTGLPGLVLGGLIFLIREPKRKGKLHSDASPKLSDTLLFLVENKNFFTAHFLGFGALSIVGWAFLSWLPAYMLRTFSWTIGQISLPLAVVIGIGSTLGLIVSGAIVDRLFGRGMLDAHFRVYGVIALGMSIFGFLAFRADTPQMFLIFSAPIVSFMTLAATAGAALQIVTPNEMRGQISAIFLLVMNGIGLGLGPLLVGALTDFVYRDEARIGDSLTTIFVTLAPFAALVLFFGCGSMRTAVGRAKRWQETPQTQ